MVGDQVLNSTVDQKSISDFTATWRLQDGIAQWSYLWSPNNVDVAFDIEYTAFMSRDNPNGAAVEFLVTPRGGNYNGSIIDLIDGRSAQRSHLVEKEGLAGTQIYVGVHPEGLPDVHGFIVSTAEVFNGYTIESSRRLVTTMGHENENNMTIGQEWDVQLIDGETAVFSEIYRCRYFGQVRAATSCRNRLLDSICADWLGRYYLRAYSCLEQAHDTQSHHRLPRSFDRKTSSERP